MIRDYANCFSENNECIVQTDELYQCSSQMDNSQLNCNYSQMPRAIHLYKEIINLLFDAQMKRILHTKYRINTPEHTVF